MALDKDAFLPAAFKKGPEIRESTEKYWNQQHSRIFVKKLIYETWKRLERSWLYERSFVTFYTLERTLNPKGGGSLRYSGYIGTCGPKGYGFSTVLVINRDSILADFAYFGYK